MSTLSLKPAYIPLIQKPCCCAVTCLQMILFRNGLGLHDQESLAIKFGVKIGQKDAAAFTSAMEIMTTSKDAGISTVESEDHINKFFDEISVPLKAKSYRYSAIGSLRDFLSEHIKANHDLWVEYHGDEIYAADSSQGKYVHDGLIESFDVSTGVATVIDPSPDHRQRFPFPLSTLENAIRGHFGRETGIVVVQRR